MWAFCTLRPHLCCPICSWVRLNPVKLPFLWVQTSLTLEFVCDSTQKWIKYELRHRSHCLISSLFLRSTKMKMSCFDGKLKFIQLNVLLNGKQKAWIIRFGGGDSTAVLCCISLPIIFAKCKHCQSPVVQLFILLDFLYTLRLSPFLLGRVSFSTFRGMHKLPSCRTENIVDCSVQLPWGVVEVPETTCAGASEDLLSPNLTARTSGATNSWEKNRFQTQTQRKPYYIKKQNRGVLFVCCF